MAVLRNWMCLLQLCITAAKPLLLLRLRSQYKPPSSFPTPKQRCVQIRTSAAHYVGEFKVGQCCSGAVCVCTGPSLRRLLPALTHWTRVPLIRLLPLAACQTPGEEACSRAERSGRTAGAAPLQCTTPTPALLIHSAPPPPATAEPFGCCTALCV